jgi:hypothetical protein
MLKLTRAATVAAERLDAVGGRIQDLSEPYRTFLAVWSAQGLIDNGSLTHFFECDFPGTPSYSLFVDAYRRIGADHAACCLERAVASFPFDHPELQIDKRNEFIRANFNDKTFTVSLWDHSFAGNGLVFEKLKHFVESNMDAFPESIHTLTRRRFFSKNSPTLKNTTPIVTVDPLDREDLYI